MIRTPLVSPVPTAAPLGSWSDDAKKAMRDNPDYFIWWYTVKSLGLAAALAALAYYVGREHGRQQR